MLHKGDSEREKKRKIFVVGVFRFYYCERREISCYATQTQSPNDFEKLHFMQTAVEKVWINVRHCRIFVFVVKFR